MATSTTTSSRPARPDSQPNFIPPLRNGDHLSGEEFLRRYEAMPELKKAELLDGRVYIDSPDSYPTIRGNTVASPVSFEDHSEPHFDLITWLGVYRSATPGVRGGDNGTVCLAPRTMPQPDAMLLIHESHGGQSRIGEDKFLHGAPELVAEVAYSSVSYDLHEKLEVYRLHGVREYIAWRVEDGSIGWFVLQDGQFDRLKPSEDGIFRSEVFPGLWLDPEALIRGDLNAALQVLQRGLASPEHVTFVAQLRAAAPQ